MNNYEKLNLYPHNIETCKKVKEAYDDGEQIVSIIKATGTGKSYIGLNLALECKDEKIVWIVPTLAIKEHIEKTINDNPNLSMERDFPNLEIRTYSSLVDMTKEEIENIPCDLLIVDELHHLGAPVWGERVSTFVDTHPDMKVFGMSAYSVRDRGTAYERDMVNPNTEELFSDTVVDRYDIYDAIIDGILPMPFVKSVLVENSKIIEDLRESQKLKRIQGTPIYYEIDRVVNGIVKTIHKQEPVREIVQNAVMEDGKYIYFCPVVSSYGNNDMDSIMKKMMEYLTERFPDKRIIFYKTTSEMGDVGEYNRECFYNDVDLDGKDASDTIRIMFAKNQYNEGVHAPNVDGVFLGRETGSDIVALEQIGRALSVRGETSLKMEEYNQYSLDKLKDIAKEKGINFNEDVSREYLIELLIAPIIIDLADNIGFLQELETNLKTRIRERKEKGISLTSRQVKILESWSTLDVSQRDLYDSLMKLRDNIQTYTWDDWYELAVVYYNHHGHSDIPKKFKTINGKDYDEEGVKLGQWCSLQRREQDKLSEDRRKKLEQIEFRFENKDEIEWEKKYQLAVLYYNCHGNSEINRNFKTINGKDYDENGVTLGRWILKQRTLREKLSEERRQKLARIGFRFETDLFERKWQQMYELALAYYKHHGNLDIHHDFKTINGYEYDEKGIKLGQWCSLQRREQDKLSEERRQKLEQIKFRFGNKFEVEWEKKYQLLVAYYNHYGNIDVPYDFKTEDGVALGVWCSIQRYKRDELSEERIKKLEQLNFVFESFKDIEWEKKYQLLVAYYNHYGNSEVSYNFKTTNGYEYDEKGIKLGQWCIIQRSDIENLTEERRQKLEQIGFRFESNLRDVKWQQMYELAVVYYNHYGNSEIPSNFKTINGKDYDQNGKALGDWLRTQRGNYSSLSEERLQKLKQIEFRLSEKRNIMIWDDWYELLVIYYKEHGNTEVPTGFKTTNGKDYDDNGVSLRSWCDVQRMEQDKLSEEKRRKLEVVKFRFGDKRDIEWRRWYELAVAYYNYHGDLNVPQKFKTTNGYEHDENGVNLGMWCLKQRTRQDKLSEEKRQKLDLIGFRFYDKEENEQKKINLCSEYGVEYNKYEILKRMSYQELYAKIMYLIDNGYSLLDGDKLHEIFSMSNENMVLKYVISKEELITNYYINKKRRGV